MSVTGVVGSAQCVVCSALFAKNANHNKACSYHPGQFDNSLRVWSCCNNRDDLGCTRGFHIDPDSTTKCEFCLKEVKTLEFKQHLAKLCVNAPGTPGTKSGTTQCEVCKQVFARSANTSTSCVTHSGSLGYLNETDDHRTWLCCKNPALEAVGCRQNWHIDAFRPIECEYCKGKVPAQEMEEHVSEKCTKTPSRKPVECEYCAKQVPKNEIESHYQQACPLYPSVDCPYAVRGCQEKMVRPEIRFHIKTCIFRDTPCPFKQFGCSATFGLEQLDIHMRDAVSLHTQILLQQVIELTTQVSTLQTENRELRTLVTTSPSLVNRPRPQQISIEDNKQLSATPTTTTGTSADPPLVRKLTQTYEQIESASKTEQTLLSPKKSNNNNNNKGGAGGNNQPLSPVSPRDKEST